jgi:hypothetical protein
VKSNRYGAPTTGSSRIGLSIVNWRKEYQCRMIRRDRIDNRFVIMIMIIRKTVSVRNDFTRDGRNLLPEIVENGKVGLVPPPFFS